jgi:alpha-D-ribose 1-methylphosphonate 5-triphosphate synthase subunit PhnI
MNNFLRFNICPKINNILHKQGILSPNVDANYGCMPTITAKSKRYPSERKEDMGIMP